jgi:hypothetical protein
MSALAPWGCWQNGDGGCFFQGREEGNFSEEKCGAERRAKFPRHQDSMGIVFPSVVPVGSAFFGERRFAGNRIRLCRPSAQIDQLATLAAKWLEFLGFGPGHGFTAGRTFDRYRHLAIPKLNL